MIAAEAPHLHEDKPDSVDVRWTGIEWLVTVIDNGKVVERSFIAETFANDFAGAHRQRLGLLSIGKGGSPLG